MKKTKIEWADATWNPVTGCLHGCEYCYARRIAERFGGYQQYERYEIPGGYRYSEWESPLGRHCGEPFDPSEHEYDEPVKKEIIHGTGYYDVEPDVTQLNVVAPYPDFFQPTFHKYLLDKPQRWKKPQTVFVCSMADLFGDWVPDEWIEEVFAACDAAPWHRYMFLTKNPKRYALLREQGIRPPDDSWIGTSCTTDSQAIKGTYELAKCWNVNASWFVSLEPILERMSREAVEDLSVMDWLIIGAETGHREGKVIPQKAWIDEICEEADARETPVFMKESLLPIVGEENMRRELPWRVREE